MRSRADSEENSRNRSFHNFFRINELVHHIDYVIEVIPPSAHSQKTIPPSSCPLRPAFSDYAQGTIEIEKDGVDKKDKRDRSLGRRIEFPNFSGEMHHATIPV